MEAINTFVFAALALTLVFCAAGAPTPLYSIYQREWHFRTVTVTVIFAVYAVALLLTLLIAGSLSDYVGRRRAATKRKTPRAGGLAGVFPFSGLGVS